MLTKDIEKVKKNIFETWNKTKTLKVAKKPIQEVEREDSKKKKSKDPLYQRMVNRAIVKYPYADKNVFSFWKGEKNKNQEPPIGNLGGGSDHVAFYMHLGIPSMSGGSGGTTLYHSNYK